MTGNKICSIICGAPDSSIDKSLLTDFVICADKGYDYAVAAGITPDIVVGDFDSSGITPAEGLEVIRVSPIKDDTDTMLAANTAIERGYDELRFFCALGGRFDHAYANVQMLQQLYQRGIKAELYGRDERVRLLHEGDVARIERFDGFVSVLAYTSTATVSESGMKYPLDWHTLDNSFPLGVSNEVSGSFGEIVVHMGTVVLCEYRGK